MNSNKISLFLIIFILLFIHNWSPVELKIIEYTLLNNRADFGCYLVT